MTLYRGTTLSLPLVSIFTIGHLARSAGVNVETIRYYERRGLIREPPRSGAGYRQYSDSDLRRLQFIARAKQLGFTLTETASLMGPDTPGSAESVVQAARAKMDDLDRRRRELDDTRSRLTRLVALCEDPTSEDCLALRVAR